MTVGRLHALNMIYLWIIPTKEHWTIWNAQRMMMIKMMTYEESLRKIKQTFCYQCKIFGKLPCEDSCELHNAMQAIEKQIPEKMLHANCIEDAFKCPKCGSVYILAGRKSKPAWCSDCGQRLR